MRPYAELLEASGYANRPRDFDELLRILDGELRLITPTDPKVQKTESDSSSPVEPNQKYYQLTHDYLVHSLRDWLTRKEPRSRETGPPDGEPLMTTEQASPARQRPGGWSSHLGRSRVHSIKGRLCVGESNRGLHMFPSFLPSSVGRGTAAVFSIQ
jgi:hypothetical protein